MLQRHFPASPLADHAGSIPPAAHVVRRPLRLCLTALAAVLAACGGGGGSGSGDGEPAAFSAAANSAAANSAAASSPAPVAATESTPVTGAQATALQVTGTDAVMVAKAEAAADAAASSAMAAVNAEASAATTADKTANGAVAVPPEAAPALATVTPPLAASPGLVIRARGTPAGGVPPLMALRINGTLVDTVSVAATQYTDYRFALPALAAGAQVDVVFTNDANVNGEDRNLYVAYLRSNGTVVQPTTANAVYDRGTGYKAFDGLDTVAAQGGMAWAGALRMRWPAATPADANLARKNDAVRFLQQASFGPTTTELSALVAKPYSVWIDEQMALPLQADFVDFVQTQWDRGDAWRPGGANYTPTTVGQAFWRTAANAPDQLRKRTAFALHQILMASQVDSNLWGHARAYARYYDQLNQHAFGNFRNLLEDISLSPAMGIYLSHLRNRKEDAATGRMPDENFAREVMQLFSIGLHELNLDSSLKRDANGKPIETYTNTDVMALAKVFTGWGWAFADTDLTDSKFRWGSPVVSAAGDQRIDLLPMKAYPNQHSTAAKSLFAGKAWATNIPANGSAQADLKLALDALFNHPNVGPFIGRQLIQRLVTSQPSAAYVARVAGVFNHNDRGVRGDLGAVVRAILLDTDARGTPSAGSGKLLEPVLRVAQWLRALGARSASGHYLMVWDLDAAGQRALLAPSVFGYYRPGYVPPNTRFAATGSTAPEFQIVNESSVAAWINTAESMAGSGLGWTSTGADVSVDHDALGALADNGDPGALVQQLNLLLLGGRMSPALQQGLLDTVASVGPGTSAAAHRARAATFLVLASAEYLIQP